MKKIGFMIYRYFIYILGIAFIALGIALMLKSKLGASGWDALVGNLNKLTGISAGLCNITIGSILLIAAAIIGKKMINFYAFGVNVLSGLFLDFWLLIVLHRINFDTLPIKLIAVCTGTIALALGCALIFVTHLPKNHTETFVFSIVDKLGKPYKIVKTVADSVALLLALTLGLVLKDFSNFGIGTIIGTFFLGYLIHYIMILLDKFLDFKKELA